MFVLGFGVHAMTHEYKVVRIVYEKEHINRFKVPPKVELYTQGIGLWREIDSAAAPPYYIVEFMWSQAFVNGAVHWVTYDPSVVGGFRNLIVSFDMVSEAFSKMMLPSALAGRRSKCLSIKLFGESLAVFCGAEMGRSCCIWVMKEYGVGESWTELFSINLPGILNKTLGFRQNGKVLLSTTNNSLISYHPGTKTMSNIGIKGSSYCHDPNPPLWGPRSSVGFPARADLRSAKVLVAFNSSSSVNSAVRAYYLSYIAPRSSVNFPARAGTMSAEKCWELDFSARAGTSPARADIENLGFPD
ncbi:hypothetical protein HYC85_012305 [Camellia sinensis]|uniref:F-box associated beta-propeller type 1 domain-containing protein n=1 Tax=Camellia sinensis TaxID=4442 RepID=A0A7J7HBK7_CAMSI|nr:hypothetical protein HYC85_012305 [Camellia sinensis]